MIKIGLLLLIAPCLLLMGLYLPEQTSMSDCVALGGSYDYQQQVCDMQNKHPVCPFMARHGFLVNSAMLLALLGFIVCLVGLYRPKKAH